MIILSNQCLGTIIKGAKREGSTEDEEEEFVDDVKFENDEGSLQLSN